MKLGRAIDGFISDYKAEGRINSRNTELAYRTKLDHLADVVQNRDPAKVGPDDIKRALGRWEGNSRRQAHTIYRSFFRWVMTERIRGTNPADMVRPTKGTKPSVARLTKPEVAQLLRTSESSLRDKWVAHLGCCAGLRSQEIRGLQGRHLSREGFVWVSADIAKGSRERFVPITADLESSIGEMSGLGHAEYVVPGRRSRGHPHPGEMYASDRMMAASTLYNQVVALGRRAEIGVRVTPHTLRHSFCTYVARYAGIRAAQSMMGHASIETTQGYTEGPTLDELQASINGFTFLDVKQPKGAMA